MAHTFDGPNKLIILELGTTIETVQNLYSRWKDWLLLSDNTKYLPAFTAIGGEPTVGGAYLGVTYFLENGWKIRPYEGNHTLTLTGNLYSRDGSSPFVNTVGTYNVLINLRTSNLVDLLSGTGAAPADIWAYGTRTLTNGDAIWNSIPGTSANSAGALLNFMYKLMRNKTETDPVSGTIKIYDDDNTTVLYTANIYENIDATQQYRDQGINRRNRLT